MQMLIEELVGLRHRGARPKGSPLYGDRLPTAGVQPRLESNVRSLGTAGCQMSAPSGYQADPALQPGQRSAPIQSIQTIDDRRLGGPQDEELCAGLGQSAHHPCVAGQEYDQGSSCLVPDAAAEGAADHTPPCGPLASRHPPGRQICHRKEARRGYTYWLIA